VLIPSPGGAKPLEEDEASILGWVGIFGDD
jgi:hypothetical protein